MTGLKPASKVVGGGVGIENSAKMKGLDCWLVGLVRMLDLGCMLFY